MRSNHKNKTRLSASRTGWLATAALGLFLSACTTTEETPPPEVESASPDWTRETGTLTKTPEPAPPPKPTAASADYALPSAEGIDAAAEQHKLTLLENDSVTLHPNEVGYYMDTLEARLVQIMRDSTIPWKRRENTFAFTLGGGDTFATNTAKVSDNARTQLAPLASILEEYDRTRVAIYGHTDDVGDERYNQQLSVRRSQAIAKLLIDAGVSADRLFVAGYGEARPAADNDSEEGRAQNRRIDLLVEPLERPRSQNQQ